MSEAPKRSNPAEALASARAQLIEGPRATGDLDRLLIPPLDQLIGELSIDLGDRAAVLAVGGYGRGQLWIHSDVDLLILHEGPPPATRALLYPLWDARIKVGHATRTVRDTLAFARDDLNALCSLLTTRLLWGRADLREELQTGLRKLLSGPRANLAELLAQEQQRVWAREPFALQEFDLKTGRGGLRTHHRLDWDRIRAELLGEEAGVPPQPGEAAALATLCRIRHALHAISRRPTDFYPIELRPAVGRWLGEDPTETATDAYRAARTLDGVAALRWGRVRTPGADPINEAGSTVVRLVRSRWARRQPASTPFAQARTAVASRSEGRLSLWERDFAAKSGPPDWSPGDRAALVSLLASGQSGWQSLLGLWEAGWLTRALPEIAHLQGLAQVAPFHAHPVDAHLGATVSEIVKLAESREWSETADSLGSLDELLLSGFLHDVGKGQGGDHSITGAVTAEALLGRIGFSLTTGEVVSKGIRHHLLLNEIAQRRDLADPTVAAEVAHQVGDLDFLHLLTLLSIADAKATGAEMWSPWKESLLRTLVDRVEGLLQGTSSDLARSLTETLYQLLAEEIDRDQIASHLEGMPPGYMARFGPEAVASHLRLVEPVPRSGEVRTALVAGAPVSNLVIVTKDRPGLLTTVAGVLSLHNLNVLEASVATRTDGVAVDSFRVTDGRGGDMIGQGRWPAVRESLELAVAGKLDLEERLAAKRPEIPLDLSVEVSGNRIEIEANDRLGLLHDLAYALGQLGVDIELAKIDTRGGRAIDVFTVRNPVDLGIEAIRSALDPQT